MSEINALFAIEPLMYFGIGFLAATLIAIAIFPLALNRAVRLTTRRVMSTMPHSLTEASAEKDTMRAMFAGRGQEIGGQDGRIGQAGCSSSGATRTPQRREHSIERSVG
jgi:hypothetical protein